MAKRGWKRRKIEFTVLDGQQRGIFAQEEADGARAMRVTWLEGGDVRWLEVQLRTDGTFRLYASSALVLSPSTSNVVDVDLVPH